MPEDLDIFGDLGVEKKKEKVVHEVEKLKFGEVLKEGISKIKEDKEFLIYIIVEAILTVILILMLFGVLKPF